MDDRIAGDGRGPVVDGPPGRQRLQRLAGVGHAGRRLCRPAAGQRPAGAAARARASATRSAAPPSPCARYINVPEPLAGEVFASQVHADGAVVRRGDFVRLGIETEIAVRLGPRPAAASAGLYAATTPRGPSPPAWPSIELVDDRYDDFAHHRRPDPDRRQCVRRRRLLGRPMRRLARARPRGADRPHLARRPAGRRGPQRRAPGPPAGRAGLARHKRSALGLGLAAGTFVSLGTITPVQWVEAPGDFRIEVEGLGEVAVKVVDSG